VLFRGEVEGLRLERPSFVAHDPVCFFCLLFFTKGWFFEINDCMTRGINNVHQFATILKTSMICIDDVVHRA